MATNIKALFIINSPFQALCAIEAINHFKIEEVHFLLFDEPSVKEMILPIVNNRGAIHLIVAKGNLTLSIVKALNTGTWKEKFKTVFVGDYYSYSQYVAAIVKSKWGSNLFYLDDGNSTLLIAPPVSLKRGRSKREKKYYGFWNAISFIKNIKKKLFSIYDLGKDCPLPVERNTFQSLTTTQTTRKGIYVIGTNSVSISFNGYSYPEKLTQLAKYLQTIYPNETVYYCPHRRDTNDYTDCINSLGWNLFETKYSVEIDFVQNRIYPLSVIGFGSTALLTLKKIYQNSDVKTIYMELESDSSNAEYRSIESYYMNNGIEVIHL